MKDQVTAAPSNSSLPPANTWFPIHGSWKVATVVAVAMVLLALLGVGLTTASSAAAPAYWVALVPLYGVLCIWTAISRSRHADGIDSRAVVRQVFHWLGIGVALALDFLIRGTGEESGKGAGLNAVLLLALGCYLAGIHLEITFVPVGILLTLALIVAAKADQYLWLVFVVGALSIAAIFGLARLAGRARRREASEGTPAQATPKPR
jgi:hypothetical protein